MKKRLIKLAKDNKFESTFLCNNPYKYSNKEDLRYLFWLTELQTWLRDVHDVHVQIKLNSWIDRTYIYTIHSKDYYVNSDARFFEEDRTIGKYEKVLEAGLSCALNMLKKNKLNLSFIYEKKV